MWTAAAEAAAGVRFRGQHAGKSILHSVCFPVLHLQIRSMGVAWKTFAVFPFFFLIAFV